MIIRFNKLLKIVIRHILKLKNEKQKKRNSWKTEYKDVSVFITTHKKLKALSVDLNIPMYELATKAVHEFLEKQINNCGGKYE